MNILWILLDIYLLSVVIEYAINFKNLDKFSEVAVSLINPNASNIESEKLKIKLASAILFFFFAFVWPIKFFLKTEQTEETD